MANVVIGDVSADMRYEIEGYGIPAMQSFLDSLNGFVPVREQVLVDTNTLYRAVQYDAAGESLTVSIEGNFLLGSVTAMQVDGFGEVLRITGRFTVDPWSETLSGTLTGMSATGSGETFVRVTGLDDYMSVSLNSGGFEQSIPEDPQLLDGADTITSGSGDDWLLGYAGRDSVLGGDGDDTLDGGTGDDTLDGGAGWDFAAFEDAAWGVQVDLRLASAQASGGGGTDTLRGIEGLIGSGFADTLTGADAAEVMRGGAGNDSLVGGAGADTLEGGAGDDVYVVDSTQDRTVEAVGGGLDTVRAPLSWTLAAEVEALVLTGSAGLRGTGNALANTIDGNGGANRLDGGAGADTLFGGFGNDVYVVDHAGDRAVDLGPAGYDEVRAVVGFTLGTGIERLVLLGSAALDGAGNARPNALSGNAGANRLAGLDGNDTILGGDGGDTLLGGLDADRLVGGRGADELRGGGGADQLAGGLGSDTLAGGGGADRFVFGVAPVAGASDVVADFVRTEGDAFQLSLAAFTGIAGTAGTALAKTAFHAAPGATAAQDADDRIVYDRSTGALYYDADGVGGVGAVQFAVVGEGSTHPVLYAGYFELTA